MNKDMFKRVTYVIIVENVRDNLKQDMRYVNTIRKASYGDRVGKVLLDRYGKIPSGRNLYKVVPEVPYKEAVLECGEPIGCSYSYWRKDASGKRVYHTDCIYTMWRYATPEGQYANMGADDPTRLVDATFDWMKEDDGIIAGIRELCEEE